ncbi:MAG: DUF4179 domain-containing protein [Lachnospiraceae bacterium]
MDKQIDQMLFETLEPQTEPPEELNCRILKMWSKEDQTVKQPIFKKWAAVAAAMTIIAAGSVTAVAAYHLLSPTQVAQEVSENNALSRAFESEDAITIGETQKSNGFEITLLGIVSGKNLSLCVPEETRADLESAHSYAAFAIAKSDGTAMDYRNFCIAPLIGGVDVHRLNAATMNETLTWFERDGVIYELVECDNLEIFAEYGVQLGVVDSFGNETAAFQMDTESGAYSKVEDYTGTVALFSLPLDASKADNKAAQEYLDSLEKEAEQDASRQETAGEDAFPDKQVQAFVDTINMDNIDQYFVRDENTVFTATPDEKGWIDFGSRYIEEEGITYNGGAGDLENWIKDGEEFAIMAVSASGNEEDTIDLSTLQINVIIRNSDGSFTEAAYTAKKDLTSYIYK